MYTVIQYFCLVYAYFRFCQYSMIKALLEAGSSPRSRPDEVNFFNLPNPSGHTSSLEFTQPLTEMSTRNRKIMFVGSKVQPVRRADSLATICGPIVYTMCDP
jgi:hypothetical protein